jgi:hypothetical protein
LALLDIRVERFLDKLAKFWFAPRRRKSLRLDLGQGQ